MKQRLILILIVLALASLACNLVSGGTPQAPQEPQPVATVAQGSTSPGGDQPATQEPQPTEEKSNNLPSLPLLPGSFNLNDLQDPPFDNYAHQTAITYEGRAVDGSDLVYVFSIELKTQTSPEPGESVTMTENKNGESQSASFITIGGMTYSYSAEMGCMSFPDDSSNSADEDTPSMQEEVNGEVKLLERNVEINGVMTDRYEIKPENLIASDDQSADPFEGFVMDQGSIYVARDGQYLVRMEFSGAQAANDNLPEIFAPDQPVTASILYDYVPAPAEGWNLSAPEACADQSTSGSDYPMMDDAFDSSVMAGLVSYKTAYTLEEVIAFYQEQLPPLGWVEGEASTFGTFGSITFTKDGKTLSITILSNGAGDTSVTIIEEK